MEDACKMRHHPTFTAPPPKQRRPGVFRLPALVAVLAAVSALGLLSAPPCLARTPMPDSLEMKPVGRFFVNLAVETGMIGEGLNEVFDADIQRLRPKTAADLQAYMNFDAISGAAAGDGPSYSWQLNADGKVYDLFQLNADGTKLAVDVFVLRFLPEQQELNKLRVLKANPVAYRDYNLAVELNALGLMGVIRKGTRNTVVFINGKSFGATTQRPFPGVAIENADAMLHSYAVKNDFDGVKTMVDIAARGNQGTFDELVALKSGQEVVDTTAKADMAAVDPKQLAGFTLPDPKVTYEYVSCIPNGNNAVGSPRAAFLPVKVDGSYPIFVFPAALCNQLVLLSALHREQLHVQWWNAITHLQDGITVTPGANAITQFTGLTNNDDKLKCILREGLLRTTVVHMEADIDAAMKTPATDTWGSRYRALFFTHRYLFVRPLAAVMNCPQDVYKVKLPWTVSEDLIIPEKAGALQFHGSVLYNNALYRVLDASDPGTWQTVKNKISGNKMPDDDATNKNDTRLVTNLFHSQAPKGLGGKKQQITRLLVDAIIYGYANDSTRRSKLLKDSAERVHDSLRSYLPAAYANSVPALATSWSAAVNSPTAAADNLMVAAVQQGFSFSDLEWLWILTQPYGDYKMPLDDLRDDTFGKRLNFLVQTQQVKYIAGLSLWQIYLKISAAELDAQVKLLTDTKALVDKLNDANLAAKLTTEQQNILATLQANVAALKADLDALGASLTAKEAARKALMDAIATLIDGLRANADVTTEPALFKNTDWKPYELTWPSLTDVDLDDSGLADLLTTFQTIADACLPAKQAADLDNRKKDLLAFIQNHNARLAYANGRMAALIATSPPQIPKIDESPCTAATFTQTEVDALTGAIPAVQTATQTALDQLLALAKTNHDAFQKSFDDAMTACATPARLAIYNQAPKFVTDDNVWTNVAQDYAMSLTTNFKADILAVAGGKSAKKAQANTSFTAITQHLEDYLNSARAYEAAKAAFAQQAVIEGTAMFCGEILKLEAQTAAFQAASDQATRAKDAVNTFITTRDGKKAQAAALDADIQALNDQLAAKRKLYDGYLQQARALLTLESLNDSTVAAATVLSDLQSGGGTVQAKVQAAFYAFFGVTPEGGAPPAGTPPADDQAAFDKLKADLTFLPTIQFMDRNGGVK